jgi:hypothetical protein
MAHLYRTTRVRALLLASLGATAVSAASVARAATSGDNGTHDPSRMIESDGKFYFFSTGGAGKSSPNGLAWSNGARIFPSGFPAWVSQTLPDTQGLWAPDVIYLNHKYYLYYSVAARTTKDCAIGLVTSPTLDPTSPSYKWTDGGLVVHSTPNDDHCSIDPAPVLDKDGNLWVVWGGGYPYPTTAQSLWVTRLDNMTGVPTPADPAPGHPVAVGHREGSYVQYHDGNYYLFWQTGGCCNGAASTYTIHVSRSSAITGPYAGDRVFYASHDSIHGPGHIGIYKGCGVERFTYHYYPDSGTSVLGENELTWGSDGWPVVGAESTTPIKPCGDTGSNASEGGSGGSMNAGGNGGAGGGGGGTDGDQGGSGGPVEIGGAGGEGGSGVSGSEESSGSAVVAMASDAGLALTSGAPAEPGCACSLPASRERTAKHGWMIAAFAALAGCRRRRAAG